MKTQDAIKIIQYVVDETRPRWKLFDEAWKDVDYNFIWRGYEQGGFAAQNFVKVLNNQGIGSISKIGCILDHYDGDKKYKRDFAGSISSPFYQKMIAGQYGSEGQKFAESIIQFKGNPGGWFWNKLWQMLVCCNHLKNNYEGSYSYYLKAKYAGYKKVQNVTESDFLSLSPEEWEIFKRVKCPWDELYGIGVNVFDFIVGDIVDANFVKDSYKLDSANIHFLKITGIANLLTNLTREDAIRFLKGLNLPYTLREMNKAFYTYCSVTEAEHFGFCRELEKCKLCGINNICEHNFI